MGIVVGNKMSKSEYGTSLNNRNITVEMWKSNFPLFSTGEAVVKTTHMLKDLSVVPTRSNPEESNRLVGD